MSAGTNSTYPGQYWRQDSYYSIRGLIVQAYQYDSLLQ